LAAGQSNASPDDGPYPLCLTEIDGAPLIQHLIAACLELTPVNFIVALPKRDITEFHLNDVINIIEPSAHVVSVPDHVSGAACTALLATGYMDNEEELLIINGNEILDVPFADIVDRFRQQRLDVGTVTFPSVHPRYSYVRLSEDNRVIEAAEKRPISRHATAGFYWFARGRDFVRAAQSMIYKNAAVNNTFYICPVLNELVLEQRCIGVFPIDASKYHPLKTTRQLMNTDLAINAGARA